MILLDEPSAGLSPVLQDQVFVRTREINKAGVSVVMVEQNARRCLQICDRGYVLDQGTNAYTDTGRNLLHDPKVIELYLGTLAKRRPDPASPSRRTRRLESLACGRRSRTTKSPPPDPETADGLPSVFSVQCSAGEHVRRRDRCSGSRHRRRWRCGSSPQPAHRRRRSRTGHRGRRSRCRSPAVDERHALGEGRALLAVTGDAVDLGGDRRRIVGAGQLGGEGR